MEIWSIPEYATSLKDLILLYSTFPIWVVLASFRFMSIQLCVDTYNMISFEPTHKLFLGISKLSKDCLLYLLKHELSLKGPMKPIKEMF